MTSTGIQPSNTFESSNPVDFRLFGGGQRLDERGIFVSLHRAVDIIRFTTVMPGREPGPLHVDGLEAHERRRRIEKLI